MKASPLSTLISTVATVEKLNNKGVAIFKQELWQQLNITDERQFLLKFLLLSFNKVHNQTLTTLQQKCKQIASNPACTFSPCEANAHMHHKHGYALLHRDEFCHLSKFLSKPECINLGLVNRHLYIETQTKKFIQDRKRGITFPIDPQTGQRKCDTLSLTERKLLTLSTLPRAGGFSYWFPSSLTFGSDSCLRHAFCQIVSHSHQKQLWTSLFTSIQTLRMLNNDVLGFVPVSTLFCRKIHKGKQIQVFEIAKMRGADSQAFELFSKKYQNYFESKCGGDISKIRHIKKLHVHDCYTSLTKFLKSLQGNYTELALESVNLDIESSECLESIFHARLRSFTMHWNDVSFHMKTKHINVRPCPSLKSLTINSESLKIQSQGGIVELARLNRFWTLFRNVEFLTLTFGNDKQGTASESNNHFLQKILQYCEGMSSLKTIHLKMVDDYRGGWSKMRLYLTASLLWQVVKWYDAKQPQLANEMGVEKIELEWHFDYMMFIYHDHTHCLSQEAMSDGVELNEHCDDDIESQLKTLFTLDDDDKGTPETQAQRVHAQFRIDVEAGLQVFKKGNIKFFFSCIDRWLLSIAQQQRKSLSMGQTTACVCIQLR